jgi:hypothetical protein
MVLKQHQKMHVIELEEEEELGVVQYCNAAVQVVVVQNNYILLIRK